MMPMALAYANSWTAFTNKLRLVVNNRWDNATIFSNEGKGKGKVLEAQNSLTDNVNLEPISTNKVEIRLAF